MGIFSSYAEMTGLSEGSTFVNEADLAEEMERLEEMESAQNLSDDPEEACIEAAQDFIRLNRNGSAQDDMGEIDRYAIACTGAVELDGAYHDAVLVSFYERALPVGYSAYVLYENPGAGDAFGWADPEPAGEEPPLI